MLSPRQRHQLLRIARESIAAVLDGRRSPIDPELFDDDLRRPAGAFVSLHTKAGDLRGCIGSIHPVAPLCQAVSSSAVNAAFRDPRFLPLGREELDSVEVEISVMGPILAVHDLDEIVVGRDGLIVRRGGRAGLLLPQVATDFRWDRDSFLSHTCVKAGLPPDAWRFPGCLVERFSAEVFSEQTTES
jgi:AmmeMemoRadiSam system protein A